MPEHTKHDERREFLRLPLVRPARLVTRERSPLEGETQDVSLSGLFVACPPRLTKGSSCAISLSTDPSGDGPSVRMSGVVRRVSPAGLGISLSPLSIDALTRLQSLVASKYADRADLFEEVRRYQARVRALTAGPAGAAVNGPRPRSGRAPKPAPPALHGLFACTDGRDKGKLFELTGEPVWVVGRSKSCDVVLDDPKASRAHCRIERREGRFFLRDLASANGTRVNNRLVTQPQTIVPGDCLQIGKSALVLRLAEASGIMPRTPEKGPDADAPPEIHWIT